MFKFHLLSENIKISINAVKSNLLRTILTVLIIAIGIMSLVGILTAVESIKYTITSEFQQMGSTTFTIKQEMLRGSSSGGRSVPYERISFKEAIQFKKDYSFPAIIGILAQGTSIATISYINEETNPNISVYGIDENFLLTVGKSFEQGRNFINSEIISGDNLVIIGSEIAKELFKFNENPIDEYISIGNVKYRVIGVLEEKGASFGNNEDRTCYVGLNNLRQNFPVSNASYSINVMPNNTESLDLAISEAEGIFRNIRRLTVYDNNNFQISKSDNLVNMMLDNIKIVTAGASIIGLITLIGASIGLMNIMLVSVSERTREIGIRKAVGANSKIIKQQFLFEAVFIGQIGGLVGIILGIVAGNMVGIITGGSFVIPWFWIIIGVLLCFVVGIASGYLPAVKASKLEPIVALRYE
jgi:putative ABC transport system permease protein